MNLSAAELAELSKDSPRIGIFFRLETTPVVRLWLGLGPIEPGSNVLDPDGVVYQGFGEIAEIPELNHLINGEAERVDFTVSGVTGEILQIASGGDAQQVKGKRVSVGFAVMDENWQLLGPVKWIQTYTADFLSIEQRVPTQPGDSIVRQVRLSCGSLMTGRRRPGFAFFTDQDQQARHPGDRFCERTPIYANGFNKTWPRLTT